MIVKKAVNIAFLPGLLICLVKTKNVGFREDF